MIALYSNSMHAFVLRELEIGRRAALCEDSEWYGDGAWVDLSYQRYMEEHGDADQPVPLLRPGDFDHDPPQPGVVLRDLPQGADPAPDRSGDPD